ncbi:MAG: TolC family outer membrane protein, partial [Gammaproteobacteria bacterium]|nr:TolC family outer membrane protein [Gammaproteobacteria bacterium]
MKKYLIILTAVVVSFAVSMDAMADTLLQVYQQSLRRDPTFKKAQYDWLTTRENLPIAISSYMPQVDVTGNFSRAYDATRGNGLAAAATANNGWSYTYGYTVSATQNIFNLPAWEAILAAGRAAKAALATYLASAQRLMDRVATAYFNVLKAREKLRFTIANKRAVYQQLVTTRQKFKVGLIAITGVYDAQSVYDQAVATEIADRNNLMDQLEDLRAITGQHYLYLQGIREQVPLIPPTPNNIGTWVRIAQRQNYTLKAQRYTVLAARYNIKEQATAGLPTVGFAANWSDQYDFSQPVTVNNDVQTGTIGLSASYDPIQGGAVIANTRKAEYQYLSSSAQLLFTDRSVVNDTRQAFLGVITGVSQVKADLQAIKSAKNALEATKAGYTVGTRTEVDVLNDLQALYQKKQQYADDQYNYLENIFELKDAAGTLSIKDLKTIDSWLTQKIRLPLSARFYPHLVKKKNVGSEVLVTKPGDDTSTKTTKQTQSKLRKEPAPLPPIKQPPGPAKGLPSVKSFQLEPPTNTHTLPTLPGTVKPRALTTQPSRKTPAHRLPRYPVPKVIKPLPPAPKTITPQVITPATKPTAPVQTLTPAKKFTAPPKTFTPAMPSSPMQMITPVKPNQPVSPEAVLQNKMPPQAVPSKQQKYQLPGVTTPVTPQPVAPRADNDSAVTPLPTPQQTAPTDKSNNAPYGLGTIPNSTPTSPSNSTKTQPNKTPKEQINDLLNWQPPKPSNNSSSLENQAKEILHTKASSPSINQQA